MLGDCDDDSAFVSRNIHAPTRRRELVAEQRVHADPWVVSPHDTSVHGNRRPKTERRRRSRAIFGDMTDPGRSVMVLGATGLVGRECVRLLLDDPSVARVVALTRRPLSDDVAPTKLRVEVVDFDRLASRGDLFAVDQIVCALGTTIKQAGSQDAFRRVDLEYPLMAAKLGLEHGAQDFLLVSALGASVQSRIFYNRMKGELEDALRTLPYRGVTIVRPSLLVGERDHFRLVEQIGKRIGWLAPGKFKPVSARRVAAALVHAARDATPGRRIIESNEIARTTDAAG
jgi:uncharacterized protein YbjT (DUF2867 family)